MQMLYNSDSYIVVQFEVPAAPPETASSDEPLLTRGGFEIVDKFARKEIYIEGALAESFKKGVQALVDGPNPEAFDEFIEGFTHLAHQPLVLQ